MHQSNVLTIGGSDSSGGAGIQADIKALNNFNVHGCTVITCVTAQNSIGVTHVEVLSRLSIKNQIDAILTDINVGAVKTGMLFNVEIIDLVSEALAEFDNPKVIDPVMVSTAGSILIEKNAIELYQKSLFPKASLLTPNIYEASLLANMDIIDKEDVALAAKRILDFGPHAVLVKGGGMASLAGTDYYLDSEGTEQWLVRRRVKTNYTHGSGCTLSASIAAGLSNGLDLLSSIETAKNYMQICLENGIQIGSIGGTVCQFKKYSDQ